MNTRRCGSGHVRQSLVDDVGCSRQRGRAIERREFTHSCDLIGWNASQDGRGTIPRRVDDDEVAESFQHVLDKSAGIVSGLNDTVDHGKGERRVVSTDRIDAFVEQFVGCVTQQVVGAFARHNIRVGTRDDLVEHRQGVANRPAAGTNDEG